MVLATTETQKLLSCIYRTGQKFGVVHVIEVLLGNDTDKIRRFGHSGDQSRELVVRPTLGFHQ